MTEWTKNSGMKSNHMPI